MAATKVAPAIPATTEAPSVESEDSLSGLWETLSGTATLRMRDAAAVKAKIAVMIRDGPRKLQVITDFDYTMSRYVDASGAPCWTTHRVMEQQAAVVDAALGKELDELKEKYMAIEFDPSLTKEQKTPHMITWWETAHDMMVKAGFHIDSLEEGVKKSRIHLRERCADAIRLVNAAGIPLVVFSAGIGNIIRWVFDRDFGATLPEYHLVSNIMEFDAAGRLAAFAPPLVHTFNKNESVVDADKGLAQLLETRSNVLLLGDSLGDVHMDVGVKTETAVLKIGFLNFNTEQLLPKYLEVYDLVLVDESSWDLPLALLKAVQNA